MNSLLKSVSIFAFLMILISMNFMAKPVLAQTDLKHCSGTVSNGDLNATAPMGSWQQTYVNGLMAAGQVQATAHNLGANSVPPLDVQLDYCLQNLVGLFTQIASFSDPLNVFQTILAKYMLSMMSQISGACNNLVKDISGLEKSALSNLNVCMTLPPLKLGLNMNGITYPTKPCNGTKVLGVTMTPVNQLNQSQIGSPSLYRLMLQQ